MSKKVKRTLFFFVGIFVGMGVVLLVFSDLFSQGKSFSEVLEIKKGAVIEDADPEVLSPEDRADADRKVIEMQDAAEEAECEKKQSEEDAREAAEEKLVEEFDSLTDAWMEPKAGGAKMADVSKFVKSFKTLPESRRDECLHRALNLVPDENIMLLVGILMDRTIEKEYVELVFNDILNRDEGIKTPVMKEIFKDKKHPCWTDAAWILDVTGELKK